MSVKIIGVGSHTPQKRLTNSDLEKMVETSDEWISTRTGIKERRIAAQGECTSDMAKEASLKALKAAGLTPADIDVIVVASITGDKIFPSTACILQSKLGASNAFCFDISAACSGLLYALEVANSLLKCDGKYKKALVIGAEKLSAITDWTDRSTCVLFGDGAAAVVLSKTDDKDGDSILSVDLGSNGNYSEILHLPAGGTAMPATHETIDGHLHYLKMGGQEVFKLAVTSMVESCRKTIAESGVPVEKIKWLVPHQANLRILNAVGSRLDLPIESVYINVDRFGNTSAASIGIALDEMVETGKLLKGDHVLLTAFGGGLTWGSMLVRW